MWDVKIIKVKDKASKVLEFYINYVGCKD